MANYVLYPLAGHVAGRGVVVRKREEATLLQGEGYFRQDSLASEAYFVNLCLSRAEMRIYLGRFMVHYFRSLLFLFTT